MKTPTGLIAPATHQDSRAAEVAALPRKFQSHMKTHRTVLKLTVALCGAFVATAALGQTTRVWDGGDGTGVNLGAATNWVGDVLPATTGGTIGDFATWNGTVPGNLVLTYNGGIGSGPGNPGLNMILTPSQAGSIRIVSPVASSANLAVGNFLTNDSPTAGLQFGDGSANILNIIWRSTPASPPYDPHYFINNSPAPIVITPNVRFQAGGGNTHIVVFGGTGDWVVTNNLTTANGVGTTLRKEGSGTWTWAGPSLAGALGNSTINTPVDIQGGALILKNSGLLGTQRITNNGTMFQFDAGIQSQTLSGPIHGGGLVRVSSGTLTLSSGQSDYTGNVELTGTGTLIVGGGENPGVNGPLGVGGTISFNGGTLQFSVNNTFDYSSRFSAAAGQTYKIDTGGQNVTFATGLTSSGATLTKSGPGTLSLTGGSTYSGLTAVNAGRLVFGGTKSGTGNITVANGAALGVTATGSQVTPAALTLGTSTGVTLEFNNVNSTVLAPLAPTAISAAGTVTVAINSGTFAAGQSYPLVSWTSGAAPTFALGTVNGAVGNLSVVGNTLQFNVTGLAFVWTGATDGNWDLVTANWTVAGSPSAFVNGGAALFDDSATGGTAVTLNAAVNPASTTVNSSTNAYNITSSGANRIGGSGGLTKSGSSTLILAGGVNTYSGVTTVNGGTLTISEIANGGVASDIGSSGSGAANLVLNGGALEYIGGGATSDRLFTLGTGGGALNASGFGALTLNNSGAVALSGTGARVLTLTGSDLNDNTLAAVVEDSGGATAVAKTGTGKWVLTANNTYTGGTTIANGTLQVGAGGATGSLGSGNVTVNNSLIFNRTGTLTNGTITGSGTVTVDGGGKVVLPGDNNYGATTINAGSTLQIGVGGSTGKLNGSASVVNDGTIIYDSTGDFTMGGFNVAISGAGNLIKRGSGLLKIIGNNSYTGWTLIEPGARLQITEGNQGQFASTVVTNNGTLLMTRQDDLVFIYSGSIVGPGVVVKDNNNQNFGVVSLTGDNTYTGGTFIGGGAIRVGDAGINGWIVGNVIFTNNTASPNNDNNRQIIFDRSDDVTFPGFIGGGVDLPLGTRGQVVQNGLGTLTLTGNNEYFGGTLINAGTLQVGNGGASGAIGTGPATVNGLLVFNRSDDLTFGGNISGLGSLVKMGAGTLTLTGTNNIQGSVTVSNGAAFLNNESFALATDVYGGTLGGTGVFYGPVTLAAGTTFAPGASANAIGTFKAISDLNIGGNMAVQVNRSLVQSNDLAEVTGTVSKTGAGTLTVANLGPTLVVGDKFTLFNQPVANGNAFTVTGGGATWNNQLHVDGSIIVQTVTAPPTAPTLNVSSSSSNLQFSWTGSGFKLQAQTNSLSVGISNNWGDYPGGGTSGVTVPVNVANGSVFFRLVSTP